MTPQIDSGPGWFSIRELRMPSHLRHATQRLTARGSRVMKDRLRGRIAQIMNTTNATQKTLVRLKSADNVGTAGGKSIITEASTQGYYWRTVKFDHPYERFFLSRMRTASHVDWDELTGLTSKHMHDVSIERN